MQAVLLDTVDSTNEVAKRLIREGRMASRGYVLAREQTAGKGQRGKTWSSPRDAGIYLSVVDRPPVTAADLSLYTRAAGVGCAMVLRETTQLDIRLKPVNDLYVENRKLGGILTEAIIQHGELQALITGVGVNLRRIPPVVTDSVMPVSLQELLAPDRFAYLEVADLVGKLVQAILRWNAIVAGGDLAALHAEWNRLRITVGSPTELWDAPV